MTVDVSLRAKWGRFTTKVAATRQEVGTGAAVVLATKWSANFARRQLDGLRDRIYDARTGLDTAADEPGLEVPQNVTYDDPIFYARIKPRIFAALMKDVPVDPADYTFIDLGCGKGAALLLALDHGFRSVVGVESNSRLVPIAQHNVEKYAAAKKIACQVEIIDADVVHYAFPDSPSVLYLYNPFGPDTLGAVVENLQSSLDRSPRDVVVAYVSPWHTATLDASGYLDRASSRSRKWAIYRTREGHRTKA